MGRRPREGVCVDPAVWPDHNPCSWVGSSQSGPLGLLAQIWTAPQGWLGLTPGVRGTSPYPKVNFSGPLACIGCSMVDQPASLFHRWLGLRDVYQEMSPHE